MSRDMLALLVKRNCPATATGRRRYSPAYRLIIHNFCVMLEASLSYLGIGVQPPTARRGQMIQQGQSYYRTAPWLVIFPGLAIMITIFAFNLLGDGLRDALDPSQRGRI